MQSPTSRSRQAGIALAPTAMQGSRIRFAGVQRLRHWRWPIGSGQEAWACAVSSGAGSG